jgi:hypothetical protein
MKLVLAGDVAVHDDGTATVASLSDPGHTYRLEQGVCTCKDYAHAPEHLCAHRLSVGFVRKIAELLPAEPAPAPGATPTTLPEAPASCNVYVSIGGHKVQVTLRDTDEQRMLERLQVLLAQYPAPQPQEHHGEGWCRKHGVQMKQTTKNGRSWWSHCLEDGQWCKGR